MQRINADGYLLRNAGLASVAVVMVLYMLVSSAYVRSGTRAIHSATPLALTTDSQAAALPLDRLSATSWELSNTFAQVVRSPTIRLIPASDLQLTSFPHQSSPSGNPTPLRIMIVLSAFSNLVATGFTTTKVKQQIGRMNVFPILGNFLAKNDNLRRAKNAEGREDELLKTPKGALIVHFIGGAVGIATCVMGENYYQFLGYLFTYGEAFISRKSRLVHPPPLVGSQPAHVHFPPQLPSCVVG